MGLVKVNTIADIFIGTYPFAESLWDNVGQTLKNYPDQQNRETNVQATMTEWDWEPNNVHIKKLKTYIINEFDKNFKYSYRHANDEGILENVEKYVKCNNFWANIYRKGDYTKQHTHFPYSFSFVYFLKTKWYYSPLVFSDSKKRVRPADGKFVIFPSYMKHGVPKHRYNEPRITLSGNIQVLKLYH